MFFPSISATEFDGIIKAHITSLLEGRIIKTYNQVPLRTANITPFFMPLCTMFTPVTFIDDVNNGQGAAVGHETTPSGSVAVMLGLSYLLYFPSVRVTARRIKGFLLLALGAFPFVAQNALWNYHNGWPNIMHNWFNRLTREPTPAVNLLCLALFLLYLMTLPLVQFLLKSRTAMLRLLRQESLRLFVLICLVPLCLLIAASFKKSAGPIGTFHFCPLSSSSRLWCWMPH